MTAQSIRLLRLVLLATCCGTTRSSISQWASSATASSSWSINPPEKAAGQSDVAPSCGDFAGAWSPSSGSSDPEWLRVFFSTPTYATSIEIFETWHAPFVTSVEVISPNGQTTIVFSGDDTTACGQALTLSLAGDILVSSVKINTATLSAGYESIDAVRMVGMLMPLVPPSPPSAPPAPPAPPASPPPPPQPPMSPAPPLKPQPAAPSIQVAGPCTVDGLCLLSSGYGIGTLQDPNAPSNGYGPNEQCWFSQLPPSGLRAVFFDVEESSSPGCSSYYDYLRIHTAQGERYFCGNSGPLGVVPLERAADDRPRLLVRSRVLDIGRVESIPRLEAVL